jgi:ubiquinone/menaquinone biosynthesis C-methylase UbiE
MLRWPGGPQANGLSMGTSEPKNPDEYTRNFDRFYTGFSGIFDFLVKHTSVYDKWLGPVIPRIRGPRVLEISFGTGWLICRYANRFQTYGIDFNQKLIGIATRNLKAAGITIPLQRANVEALPYRSETFDTVVNTMAFSGYPRADFAMREIRRVLKPGGRLLLVDFGLPNDRNWIGSAFARLMASSGDIMRDMPAIFLRYDFKFDDVEVGGFGAFHFYIAEKS